MESTKRPKREPLQPLIIFPLSFYRFTHTLFGKTTCFCQIVSFLPNRIIFSLFSSITTAFSVKLIHLSPKTNNILLLFTFPLYTITETPDFCVIVYFIRIVRFFPNRHPISGIQKHEKRGSANHSGKPLYTQNP